MNTKLAQIAAAVVLGLTATASAVQAGPPPHNINARQAEQQKRIRQGVRSGQLTATERRRIKAREAAIHRQEVRYRLSHGKLSVAERARLERELNQTSRAIYGNKHDYQNYRHH